MKNKSNIFISSLLCCSISIEVQAENNITNLTSFDVKKVDSYTKDLKKSNALDQVVQESQSRVDNIYKMYNEATVIKKKVDDVIQNQDKYILEERKNQIASEIKRLKSVGASQNRIRQQEDLLGSIKNNKEF